jgi:hypothetical protein
VLSPIAQRQYVDWQAFRHAEVHTPAMREAIGSFARKIVEALHQPWVSPEERAREAESAARALAEEERRRQEIEARQRAEEETRRREADAEAQRLAEERRQHELDAKRRVDEENQRRQVEAETRQRAEAERLAHQAEAEQRAKEDRAFAAAKIAGTMKAVDEFLSAYPESRFVSEAKALRATLVDREESYSVAVKSDDPAVLKSFLARYPKGAGAKEVRRRLRRIDPEHPARQWPLKLAIGGILLAVALGMVLLVHAR